MSTYEERREAKQDRLDARADKLRAEAARRFNAADRAVAGIPFGQPILVGHHSEGRHRAALARCDANVRAGIEAQRAAAAIPSAPTTAILASDDDATDLLAAEIARLEERQAHMNATNARVRKHNRAVMAAGGADLDRSGFEQFQLTNNSANIRRLKLRLANLSAVKAKPSTEREVAGVRVEEDTDAVRLRLHFPGKPAPAIIAELKARGFRWAPSEGAWQRQLSNSARWAADCVLKLVEAATIRAA